MKQIIAFLAITLLPFYVFSQPNIDWQKSFGGTWSSYTISGMVKTTDGGAIVCGSKLYVPNTNSSYIGILIKFDALGTVSWQKEYPRIIALNDVQQTIDGGYIAVGYGAHPQDYSFSAVIIKMNVNGDTTWQKYLHRTFSSTAKSVCQSVQQTNDGSYIVAGTLAYAFGTGSDAFAANLSLNGDVVWDKLYDLSVGGTVKANTDEGLAIRELPDGYILAGSRQHPDPLDILHNYSDCAIAKLDGSGVLLWQKNFGGSGDGKFYSVAATADGGAIAVGYNSASDGSITGTHGGEDCWVVKLDATGATSWQQSFGGSGNDRAYSVSAIEDNSYIISGKTASADGDITGKASPAGNDDAWVIKLNSTGNLLWQKSFGGKGSDAATAIRISGTDFLFGGTYGSSGYYADNFWLAKLDNTGNLIWQNASGASGGAARVTNVEQTTNGYLIAGNVSITDGDVSLNHGYYDGWVIQTNLAGDLAWQRTYGGSADDFIQAISKTTDGGFILAATSASNNGDVSGNHGQSDFWIVKADAAGNIVWQKSYGGSGRDSATAIHETADGAYIIVGSTTSNDGDVTGNHGLTDFWIIKVDQAGTLFWQKALGGSGVDIATAVDLTADNGYMIAGRTTSTGGNVTGNHGGEDYWVVKLDNSGNVQWQKTLGGANQDFATGIKKTNDGGCIVVGTSYSSDGNVQNRPFDYSADYWAVKLDNVGNIGWAKAYGSSSNEIASSITPTPDGGFVLAGTADGAYEFSGGDPVGYHGASDFWVMGISSSGDLLWQKMLGGNLADSAYAVLQTNNGLTVAGVSYSQNGDISNASPANYMNAWIVKLSGVLLPVTLLNFNGAIQHNMGVLQWRTLTEYKNADFEIQRSSDGLHFNNIGLVHGFGPSSSGNSYSFTDKDNVSGLQYYRIKQTDTNGQFTYSAVIVLQYSAFNWKLINNPVTANTMLLLQLDRQAKVSIQILSPAGILIKKSDKGQVSAGDYSYPLNFSELPKGLYVVMLRVDDRVYTKSVIKN